MQAHSLQDNIVNIGLPVSGLNLFFEQCPKNFIGLKKEGRKEGITIMQ